VLNKAEYSAFESTLNSSVVSYRIVVLYKARHEITYALVTIFNKSFESKQIPVDCYSLQSHLQVN